MIRVSDILPGLAERLGIAFPADRYESTGRAVDRVRARPGAADTGQVPEEPLDIEPQLAECAVKEGHVRP